MILASLRCLIVEFSILHSSLIIAAGDHSSFSDHGQSVALHSTLLIPHLNYVAILVAVTTAAAVATTGIVATGVATS